MNKKTNKIHIGLVLAHTGTNYGALLQAFATQQFVDKLGFETEIIAHRLVHGTRKVKFDFGLIPYYILNELFKKKQMHKGDLTPVHLDNIEKRKNVSDKFRNQMLHDINVYDGFLELQHAALKCNAVLIGSDQLWLPGVSFGNHLSLRFVPDQVRKISYATSLGVSEYPWYCKHSAKQMWERIEHLAVREEQGRDIIKSICPNKNVKVVVDPTYLLTRQEWESIIPVERLEKDKYILCYFLGNDESQKIMASEFAKKKGLILISLLSNESVSPIDLTYADNTIIGASPEEFVNWIRGAEYIFTDSFHGLAFSVINEKQFFIFYRRRDDAKLSRNSRIDNILSMWNLQNRLIKTYNIDCDSLGVIDYDRVNRIIESKRKDSIDYLTNSLF